MQIFEDVDNQGRTILIDRWKRMEPTRFRCSCWGRADRIEARLAWDASVNPLADSKEEDG